jgi:hypothetical protein
MSGRKDVGFLSESSSFDLRSFDLRLVLVLVLLAVLVLPVFARMYYKNDAMVGSESYYHLALAKQLVSSGSVDLFKTPSVVSDSVFLERQRYFTPFHHLLAWCLVLLGGYSVFVLPALFGVIAVLLFYLLLSSFGFEVHERVVMLLVLVLNPAFMYTFSVLNVHAASIVFTLAGFLFFLRKGRFFLLLSVVCFSIVALFSIFNILLAFFLLLVYVLSSKEKQDWFVIVLLVVSVISFSNHTELFYNYNTEVSRFDIFGNFISDLGGMVGFGVFTLILAVYGIVSRWKHKGVFLLYFSLALLLVLASLLVGSVANMYAMFFVAVAAGVGFGRLLESGWRLGMIKKMTVLIMICGFVFSSVSFINRMIDSPPDPVILESLGWMRENAYHDGYVLSAYDNGYWLMSVGGMKVFADPLSAQGYDQRFLYKVADSVFYSRNLKGVKEILQRYDIRYIFIDGAMKGGGVWNRDDEGLLFLLSDKDTFKKIYSQGDVEIYRVELDAVKN